MESLSPIVWIVIAGVVLVVVWLLVRLAMRARKVDLTTTPEGEQPEWMRTTPPPETRAANGGRPGEVFGHEPGERLAAPFAEQIEDIVRARLRREPTLSHYQIDLGSTESGDLEIWVNGERYTDVDNLPDERLRRAFRDAIDQWEET
jgi:hypothetical protein